MAQDERTRSGAAVFGASGGIGGALVALLAASGGYDRVYAGSRRANEPGGHGVIPFTFDLEDEGSIHAAVAAMPAIPETVIVASGMLHDAARAIMPEKSLGAIDGAAMARVLAVNTIGPALIAKHVLKRMPRDRRCVFAVLSARVGSMGDNRLGGWHAYRASKAALNMVMINCAIEMRRTHPHAIIAALHPGTVASDLSAPFRGGEVFSPETSATHLLRVIDGLTPADSGGFFAWDGARIAW
jgi:NAD(P)-dependent dehydrogenase (short-subunit alcohol dehydrogenase family)